METIKIEDINFNYSVVKKAVEKAIDYGFNVYVNKPEFKTTYFFFEDANGNIGYCQGDYGSLQFNTVQKPCMSSGTGFQIDDNTCDTSKEMFLSCFVKAPCWGNNIGDIVKYKNFEQKAKTSILAYRIVVK